MATHSSILACKIPWTEEPGGLQSISIESQRVRHDTVSYTQYTCSLKITRNVFPFSPLLDAHSEIGPSGKTQSPSDLSSFVTLNWDGVCAGGGGDFIIQ